MREDRFEKITRRRAFMFTFLFYMVVAGLAYQVLLTDMDWVQYLPEFMQEWFGGMEVDRA